MPLLTSVLLALVAPADACGTWSLKSPADTSRMRFLIHTATWERQGSPPVAAFRFDRGEDGWVAKGDGVDLAMAGNAVLSGGRPVGEWLAPDTLRLGAETYTLVATAVPASSEWTLSIRRDDQPLYTAEHAAGLCLGPPEEALEEIRARVAFTLLYTTTPRPAPAP